MLDIKFLENSGLFKELILKGKQQVFDEGENDENLYIITKGECIIEKYTNDERKEKRTIAYLKAGDFIGESGLSSWKKKAVSFSTISESRLIYINAKKDIKELVSKHPYKGLELLKYIILVSNDRLAKSNSLLVENFEISKAISEVHHVNNKNLFLLMDKINSVTKCSYIQYFEANQVVDNYLTLKYDTREKGILKDTVIELKKNLTKTLLQENGVYTGEHIIVDKLELGEFNLGYIVLGKEVGKFSKDDKLIINSIGQSLAGIIRQKMVLEENKNLDFLHNLDN